MVFEIVIIRLFLFWVILMTLSFPGNLTWLWFSWCCYGGYSYAVCLFIRACLEECEKSGCVGERCFQHCKFSSDGKPIDGPWYLQEPLYQKWKQWDCATDCRYHCMIAREEQREKLGDKPVKYHGKWPFRRVFGIQVLSISPLYCCHVVF